MKQYVGMIHQSSAIRYTSTGKWPHHGFWKWPCAMIIVRKNLQLSHLGSRAGGAASPSGAASACRHTRAAGTSGEARRAAARHARGSGRTTSSRPRVGARDPAVEDGRQAPPRIAHEDEARGRAEQRRGGRRCAAPGRSGVELIRPLRSPLEGVKGEAWLPRQFAAADLEF